MSLKRLLNPENSDDYQHQHHRPLEGWNDNGIPIDITPALPDTSWDAYFGELLNPEGLNATDGQDGNGYDLNHESLFYAQEQIEEWAAENVPSQVTSTQATEPPEEQGEQICYGMIFRAPVRLRGDMSVLDTKLSSGGGYPIPGHYQMKIIRSDEQFTISFSDDTPLGDANAQLEKALTGIAEQQYTLDLEVFAPIRPIRETISRVTKEKEAIVRVNINVYGPRHIVRGVGQELSEHKIYLQRPDYMKPGFIYDNPHVLKLADFELSVDEQVVEVREEKQPESELQKAEAFKKTISTIYSSLTRGQSLADLEGDERLKTKLLPHQKQGLDFMTQRENGPIPEKFRLWETSETDGKPCYRHLITKKPYILEYVETGGGILADEMGMGKTLSILALILRTLSAAHDWAAEDDGATQDMTSERKRQRRARATLIVASSDLMINEWFQEMDRHFHRQVRDALRCVKYHGIARQTDPEKLCDADIVITTYHTLYSDFARDKHPLREIEWHRLVLDEAHIIRRQSTVLYRTVAELKARSRWCLTGTPIQNRLEDIGSLFAFIKIVPFNSPSNFRKFIALPFDDGGKRRDMAIERFTRLLDSLCLRRTKDLLHLPEQYDYVRKIDFSTEERNQYEQTKKIMLRAAKNQVGGFDQKSTLGLFQVQLQLRILCNHGSYQQPFSWSRRKLHLLDEREAMEASLGRDGEVTCSACKQAMPLLGSGSMFRRFTENCRHVLCSECIDESMTTAPDGQPASCPLCSSLWLHASRTAKLKYSEDERYFRSHGKSSKMEALMRDVQADVWVTKSIIFSCWTHTLDLISMYLQRAAITFQRIDGECPTAKRERILDDFAHNPGLRVLIMTTGTGAVGLNLATANRVFIVEPQWNPSVENQAIARALRLGQEQAVRVTRYVVNKTVEQEMRSLQDRKLKMAGMAWE